MEHDVPAVTSLNANPDVSAFKPSNHLIESEVVVRGGPELASAIPYTVVGDTTCRVAIARVTFVRAASRRDHLLECFAATALVRH